MYTDGDRTRFPVDSSGPNHGVGLVVHISNHQYWSLKSLWIALPTRLPNEEQDITQKPSGYPGTGSAEAYSSS